MYGRNNFTVKIKLFLTLLFGIGLSGHCESETMSKEVNRVKISNIQEHSVDIQFKAVDGADTYNVFYLKAGLMDVKATKYETALKPNENDDGGIMKRTIYNLPSGEKLELYAVAYDKDGNWKGMINTSEEFTTLGVSDGTYFNHGSVDF